MANGGNHPGDDDHGIQRGPRVTADAPKPSSHLKPDPAAIHRQRDEYPPEQGGLRRPSAHHAEPVVTGDIFPEGSFPSEGPTESHGPMLPQPEPVDERSSSESTLRADDPQHGRPAAKRDSRNIPGQHVEMPPSYTRSNAPHQETPSARDARHVRRPRGDQGVPDVPSNTLLHRTHDRPVEVKTKEGAAGDATQYRLFIAPSRSINLYKGPLGHLTRFFALDVGDHAVLSSKAVPDLHFMALVLAVIVTFEFAAWSLLFVAILNAGKLTFFTWFTPLACLFGGTMAVLIFVFERQILVSDPGKQGRKLMFTLAYLARVLLVLVSAYFTARPVELMAFRSRINTRAYEEQVLAKAARLLQDYEDLQNKSVVDPTKAGAQLRQSDVGQDLQGARDQRDAARGDLATAQANLDNAKRALDRWRKSVRRGKARLSREEKKYQQFVEQGADHQDIDAAAQAVNLWTRRAKWRNDERIKAYQQVTRAENALTNAQANLTAADSAVAGEATRFDKRLDVIEKREEKRADEAKTDLAKLTAFIERIRDAQPGTHFPPLADEPRSKMSFVPDEYDMYEQLRVLSDLLNASPPAWPVTSTSSPVRSRLINDFQFPPPLLAEADPGVQIREKERAKGLTAIYYAIIGFAMLVPMLSLINKLFASRDLSLYFASRDQDMYSGSSTDHASSPPEPPTEPSGFSQRPVTRV